MKAWVARRRRFAAGAAILLAAPLWLAALDALRSRAMIEASLAGGNRVELHGQSNVGDWDCAATVLAAEARVEADPELFAAAFARFDAGPAGEPVSDFTDWGLTAPPSLRLIVPVKALDCGHAGMNKDLRRALLAKQHPEIIFDLLRVKSLHWLSSGNYALSTVGTLRLAGTERTLDLYLRVTRQPDHSFRVTAELPVRMTQFGIRPPSGLFGIIRAKDALRIRFILQFVRRDQIVTLSRVSDVRYDVLIPIIGKRNKSA